MTVPLDRRSDRDNDIADLPAGLDVSVASTIWSKRYRLSMTGLNAPDSIVSLKCLTFSWSCFGGMGNMTFFPPSSGVTSAKIGLRDSGPRSDER